MATSIEREAHESRKFDFARYVGFSIGNKLVTSFLDQLSCTPWDQNSLLATHNSSTKPSDSGTNRYNSVQPCWQPNINDLTMSQLCLIAAPFSGSRQPGWPSSAGSFYHQFPGLSRSLRSLQVPQTSQVPLHSPEQSGKASVHKLISTVHVLIQNHTNLPAIATIQLFRDIQGINKIVDPMNIYAQKPSTFLRNVPCESSNCQSCI